MKKSFLREILTACSGLNTKSCEDYPFIENLLEFEESVRSHYNLINKAINEKVHPFDEDQEKLATALDGIQMKMAVTHQLNDRTAQEEYKKLRDEYSTELFDGLNEVVTARKKAWDEKFDGKLPSVDIKKLRKLKPNIGIYKVFLLVDKYNKTKSKK